MSTLVRSYLQLTDTDTI